MVSAWLRLFKTITIAALFLAVCACSAPSHAPPTKSPNVVTDNTVAVPEFSIRVRLSAIAKNQLEITHEDVLVTAYFDGDPLPGQGKGNSPARGVVLGNDEKLVDATNLATFDATKISQSNYNRLSDNNYFVTINVVSARRSSNNNVLDCGVKEGRIAEFAKKTTQVSCAMIGELR